MILLRVLSYNGARVDGPSAQFDELGGTIGRADTNQLVLPDPERTISRVHARVVFRNGGYGVVDNGSNPISVNGMALGSGREQALKPGDEIQIGGYLLAVSAAVAPAAGDDPFADLFGDAPGLAVPAVAPAPAWAVPAVPITPVSPVAPPAPPARRPAPPPALSPGHIPEDWDPFAPDPVEAPAAGLPADALAGLPQGGDDSLDQLFGLGPTPLQGDPLGAAPAQALLAPPNMAGHADALQALGRQPVLAPASRSDHASELNTPMPLPPAVRPPAAQPAPPQPRGAVFSWQDPPTGGQVVTLPGIHRAAPDVPAAP
ncbi:MAG: FHA domain-containing protein, partial [Burkholderiales bacterium]|nr:FHA domain-containing protein [Burkholderiales bacterium]